MNEDIWTRFFKQGNSSEYSVYVHCTNPDECKNNIRSPIYKMTHTVPSTYCEDLVSPAIELFKAAVNEVSDMRSANDKFLLLSDNSVPVKPFKTMQENFLKSSKSIFGFCEEQGECGYKSSQFQILNRAHAELMAKTDVRESRRLWNCHPDWKCFDEYFSLNMLFGFGQFGKTEAGGYAARRNASFMQNSRRRKKKNQEAGSCDTNANVHGIEYSSFMFFHFGHFPNGTFQPYVTIEMMEKRMVPEIPKSGHMEMFQGPMGPATFVKLSPQALIDFRKSEYFFIRKVYSEDLPQFKACTFSGSMSLPEAFSKYVFEV